MEHLRPELPLRANTGSLLHGVSAGFASPPGEGLLSLKTMARGAAEYRVGRGRYRVGPDRFLLLNHRQSYIVEVPAGVESFCVFFEPRYAAEALRALRLGHHALLDAPDHDTAPPEFCERTYRLEGPLAATLLALRERSRAAPLSSDRLDAILTLLLERLFEQQLGLRAEMAALPGLRFATRAELYRRLHLGRDFLEARLTSPPALAETAAVAELSPYHFARSFQALFGESPGSYLTRRRFELAAAALAAGDRSVTDVCFDLGFASLGTFSRRFKERFGRSPNDYRRAQRAHPGPAGTSGSGEDDVGTGPATAPSDRSDPEVGGTAWRRSSS